MNHNVLDTPFRQQQDVGRDADAAVFDIALAPARDSGLVIDDAWLNTHLFYCYTSGSHAVIAATKLWNYSETVKQLSKNYNRGMQGVSI